MLSKNNSLNILIWDVVTFEYSRSKIVFEMTIIFMKLNCVYDIIYRQLFSTYFLKCKNRYFVLRKKQMFTIPFKKKNSHANLHLSVALIFSSHHLSFSISFSKSHNFCVAPRTRRHFIREINSTRSNDAYARLA